jgi:mRNA-degrading endonuclease toxin of MazEF toxin-antitoxin module
VAIAHWQQAGLRAPSIARMEKLATVEKSTVVKSLGQLAADDWKKVKAVLKELFDNILAR